MPEPLELLELPDGPGLAAEFEPLTGPDPAEEPAAPGFVPLDAEPWAAVPGLEAPAPDGALAGTLPVPAEEEFALVTATCLAPGSTTATAPATITLATPTVAVVALRRRRPRSRSAMAYETLRAAAPRGPRSRGGQSRNSGLLMLPVWPIRPGSLSGLDLRML